MQHTLNIGPEKANFINRIIAIIGLLRKIADHKRL